MKEIARDLVLDKIKPTSDEQANLEKSVHELRKKITDCASDLKIKCHVKVGGSFGKGTYLKGSSDVDFFVRFDVKYDDEQLSKMLKQILDCSKIKYKKQKGSRDYYSGSFGNSSSKINFEMVPVRNVKKVSDALNSTDLSAFHVDFVLDKIKKNLSLSDEIRLAKQFFKAKHLYGAESYIGGFSGHVIDILIIFYGSLEKLLKGGALWGDRKYIDVKEHYKNVEDGIKEIGSDKNSDLVLIDPIIPNRNAARALSSENYSRFILIANSTSELKASDFEVRKERKDVKLRKWIEFAKKSNLQPVVYELGFVLKDESEDVSGSKLRKLHGKVLKYLTSFDFVLFSDEFYIDIKTGSCMFMFLFERVTLPRVRKVKGPKVHMKDAVEKFLAKRKGYFIEGDRVCVYEKREITKLSEVVNINRNDMEELLGKDLGFVKSLKVWK